MKKFKSVAMDSIEISDILCNKCGVKLEKDKFGYYRPFFNNSFRWSYPSTFDNEIHSFELCEDCYKDFISTFKIPPTIEN